MHTKHVLGTSTFDLKFCEITIERKRVEYE